MSKLPSLTGEQVVGALRKAGFEIVRQKGSHVFLRHPDGRSTVVPLHAGETIGPGLLRKIIRDAEMTREEFRSLL
ncbi:MAG TPA: type II toxin-antitoxin system HicA family toxin [Chloroflexi bacterium]|nr:type II toxin-antitoxin system HicA family toxin [Chloroflexota bacterium]